MYCVSRRVLMECHNPFTPPHSAILVRYPPQRRRSEMDRKSKSVMGASGRTEVDERICAPFSALSPLNISIFFFLPSFVILPLDWRKTTKRSAKKRDLQNFDREKEERNNENVVGYSPLGSATVLNQRSFGIGNLFNLRRRNDESRATKRSA